MKLAEGDKVFLDNKVPCVVDGFYKEFVVVKVLWDGTARAIWGFMHSDDELSTQIAYYAFSMMIVDPSNLRKRVN